MICQICKNIMKEDYVRYICKNNHGVTSIFANTLIYKDFSIIRMTFLSNNTYYEFFIKEKNEILITKFSTFEQISFIIKEINDFTLDNVFERCEKLFHKIMKLQTFS